MVKVETSYLMSGIRNEGDSNLKRVNISELATILKSDGARLVADKEGRLHFHLTNSKTKQYFSIGVGKSVELTTAGNARIAELVNDYTVYTNDKDRNGNQLEKPWFSFGSVGTTNEPEAIVSGKELAKLMAGALSLEAGA